MQCAQHSILFFQSGSKIKNTPGRARGILILENDGGRTTGVKGKLRAFPWVHHERSKQGKSLADLLSVHLIRFTSERTVNFRYSTTVRLYYSCTATAVTAVQL